MPEFYDQFEVCLNISFTFFLNILLHNESARTLTCVHDVRPGVRFERIVCLRPD